jgi:branched-subunit amino acid aminotransferase/4-amino-4-deoxychorismate lyase
VDAVTALPRIEVNGHPATAEELSHPALVNYGHFTAMQVRGGRTRGIDLHLARLDSANNVLFGAGLDAQLVRERIRHALGDIQDAAVRVSVFWPTVTTVLRSWSSYARRSIRRARRRACRRRSTSVPSRT